LWRELHPNAPMQLQLSFRNADETETSKALVREPSGKVLPLLAVPNAAPLIATLADIRCGFSQSVYDLGPLSGIVPRISGSRGTDGKRDSDGAVALEVHS
jgi:hypothetical protein